MFIIWCAFSFNFNIITTESEDDKIFKVSKYLEMSKYLMISKYLKVSKY